MPDLNQRQLEQRRRAALVHGAYAIEIRGEAALTEAERETFAEIKAAMDSPEGVRELLVGRVAVSLMILGRIEAYMAGQVARGTDLSRILILRQWPAFQNSTLRGLAQLAALTKEKPEDLLETMARAGERHDETEA